jgi:DNA processing protein
LAVLPGPPDAPSSAAADERQAWIALASVTGIGEEWMSTLLASFGSARATLAAAGEGSLGRWSAERRRDGLPALGQPVLAGIARAARDPAERLAGIAAAGLWTLTPFDESYPTRLRDLDPPPAVIHGWGDPAVLDTPRMVALVGTRRPTPAGRLLAARVAARLVENETVVVSGLAVGIDGVGHAATVEHGGRTVAVIGAGHGRPGPRAHLQLRQAIVDGSGAIVGEHHPEVRPTRGTYPRRNRIIAALADAVIVVEAPLRSGALITAHRALELDRPVFVAPGRVGEWATAGALTLLRETPARVLVGLDELVADLGYLGPAAAGRSLSVVAGAREPALATLGPTERRVAERLCRGPAGLDLLVVDTGLPPAVVSGAVTLLMLRGWLQPVGPAYVPAGPLLG